MSDDTGSTPRAPGAAARFAPGERVLTRAVDPDRHTRIPAYARGKPGRVLAVTGSWPLADDVAARSAAPRVEPVYTVAFAARDLWGEGTHEVTLDLWQSYLEPLEPLEPLGTAASAPPSPQPPPPSDSREEPAT